jgi:hypothetical protein
MDDVATGRLGLSRGRFFGGNRFRVESRSRNGIISVVMYNQP